MPRVHTVFTVCRCFSRWIIFAFSCCFLSARAEEPLFVFPSMLELTSDVTTDAAIATQNEICTKQMKRGKGIQVASVDGGNAQSVIASRQLNE